MKIRDDFLYYSRPYFDEDEINAVTDVLRSGWWTKGKVTVEFEERFAKLVGAKYALAVNSCTAALHLALAVYGICEGDEVITTPMTFCSTVNTILNCGAKPVFVDVDAETGLIDPNEIEKAITERTKAILPVHYAGLVCDMDRINKIAEKHGLKVIEDAAHGLTSEYKGKQVGSFGNATAYSFYVTKNLATGEGGMLTSDDKDFIDRARVLSLHGMSRDAWKRYGAKSSWKYAVEEAGFKYNITDIASALGVEQLNKLDKMQSIRKEYARIYDERFADCPYVSRVKPADDFVESSEHLYILKLNLDTLIIDRDEFIEKLADYNVGTSVHFIPLHLQPLYRRVLNTKEGDYPRCEAFYNRIISLPLYPSMTGDDVNYVADAVCEIAAKFGK